jgi:hypothetical protein
MLSENLLFKKYLEGRKPARIATKKKRKRGTSKLELKPHNLMSLKFMTL